MTFPTPDGPQRVEGLLERLRAATGELDDETLGRVIAQALGLPFNRVTISCGDDGSDEFNLYCYPEHVAQYLDYRSRCPDVSLDAALALCERVLPKSSVALAIYPTEAHASVGVDHTGLAPTAPLAVLIALLSALTPRSQEQ